MTAHNCEVYTDCSVCNAFISNWSYHQGAYYCVNCIEVIE